jgi:hypothetical protein
MDWFEAIVKFNINGRAVKFNVINNFPNEFNSALDCWLARTKTFTVKSFCEYVMNKNTEHIAMTKKTFDNLITNQLNIKL